MLRFELEFLDWLLEQEEADPQAPFAGITPVRPLELHRQASRPFTAEIPPKVHEALKEAEDWWDALKRVLKVLWKYKFDIFQNAFKAKYIWQFPWWAIRQLANMANTVITTIPHIITSAMSSSVQLIRCIRAEFKSAPQEPAEKVTASPPFGRGLHVGAMEDLPTMKIKLAPDTEACRTALEKWKASMRELKQMGLVAVIFAFGGPLIGEQLASLTETFKGAWWLVPLAFVWKLAGAILHTLYHKFIEPIVEAPEGIYREKFKREMEFVDENIIPPKIKQAAELTTGIIPGSWKLIAKDVKSTIKNIKSFAAGQAAPAQEPQPIAGEPLQKAARPVESYRAIDLMLYESYLRNYSEDKLDFHLAANCL